MPSTDPRVDTYIARAAPFARPILTHLRGLIRTACPAVDETIKWRHPNFLHQGRILCNFAAFKEHAAFGFWHKKMHAMLVADGYQTGDAMGVMGRLTSLKDWVNRRRIRC